MSLGLGILAVTAIAGCAVFMVLVATGWPDSIALAGFLGIPFCLLVGIALGFHRAWFEHRGQMRELQAELGRTEVVRQLVPPAYWKLWPSVAWLVAAVPVTGLMALALSELKERTQWVVWASIAALSLGLFVCAWGAVIRFAEWKLVRRACAKQCRGS